MIKTLRIADCGLRYDSRNPQSANPVIRNPHSAIRNPQSTINPQSAIRNPHCHSSRFASTMAPIIATSSSIEAISNGIR
jgi:hypothetical protein